jgi:hypothetical protein
MNIDHLPPVPDYGDVVERNDIDILSVPGDLTILNGDIAVTRRGDLMLNSEEYSAFVTLVNWWRFNYPVLSVLFYAVFEPEVEKEELGQALESPLVEVGLRGLRSVEVFDHKEFHRVNNETGAKEIAKGVYAGTIAIALSNALLAFRHDIRADKSAWDKACPLFGGFSVGQVVVASANNVRHGDEWQVTRPPTAKQLQSLTVLAGALSEPLDPPDGSRHRFHREVSPEILNVLSEKSFESLEKCICSFARRIDPT